MTDTLSAPSPAAMPDPHDFAALAAAHPGQHVERVLWVRHWTDRLFSFAITRPSTFRFRSGEFVMIGLPAEPGQKKPTARSPRACSRSRWAIPC